MATVVNKTTLQVIESAHTPEYPAAEWLHNPTLPAAPRRYWKVSAGGLVTMTQAERDAADAAAASVALARAKAARIAAAITARTRRAAEADPATSATIDEINRKRSVAGVESVEV
jgi:hypothetical protein